MFCTPRIYHFYSGATGSEGGGEGRRRLINKDKLSQGVILRSQLETVSATLLSLFDKHDRTTKSHLRTGFRPLTKLSSCRVIINNRGMMMMM